MVDTLRETRTMVLCSLPYPPLPVRVGKVANNEFTIEGDSVVCTHTLLAQLINACVLKNDQTFNKEREKKQRMVLQEFLHRLGCGGFDWTDPKVLYQFYCEFNYKHIGTYFNTEKGERPPEVCFMPYDFMSVGDKHHTKLCEYFKAQGVIFEEKEIEDVSKKDLGYILFKLRDRMGHSEDLPGSSSKGGDSPDI